MRAIRTSRFLADAVIAVAFVTALIVAAAPARAASIDWAHWDSYPALTATLGNTTATYAGDPGISFPPGGPPSPGSAGGAFWGPSTTYADGAIVNNPPPVAGGIIQLFGGPNYGTETVTFGRAVTNPVMAIWSLGQPGITALFIFNQPIQFVAGGPSNEGLAYGWSGTGSINVAGNTVYGEEGNGTIQFLGTYNSISWTNPVHEDWYGFTVGAPTPLPATWTMMLLGLAALGFLAYRRQKQNASLAVA